MMAAPQAADAADRAPVVLVCSLAGARPAKSGLTEPAVCARFAARLSNEMGNRIVLAQAAPPQRAGQRWIRADLRLLPREKVEARLTSYLHARKINYPSIAVQAMDKSLGLSEIDQLAKHAARLLGQD